MARWIPLLFAAALTLSAQEPKQQGPAPAPAPDELKRERPAPNTGPVEPPPEEDEQYKETRYSFNPVQSQKDVSVGDQYLKRGSYRAAAGRYLEATRWNDANSGAWLRLAEVSEKTKDKKTALDAYTRYLKLEPDAKNAAEIKKRIAKLK
jgi:tetratricopeptide (TPR) repeat protein